MKTRPLQFTGERLVDDTSRGTLATERYLASNVLLNGVYLATDPSTSQLGYTFTSGQTRTLTHGLGYKLSGWLVVDDNGSSKGSLLRATSIDDTQYIKLTHLGAASCSVKLWVF
jgi:hypothetical protein